MTTQVFGQTALVCLVLAATGCAPKGAPASAGGGTNTVREGEARQIVQQQPGDARNLTHACETLAIVSNTTSGYVSALQAMNVIDALVSSLGKDQECVTVDVNAVRAVLASETATEVLLTRLRAIAVTKGSYQVLTALYGVMHKEAPGAQARCQAGAQWGDAAWQMYDGDMARAIFGQVIAETDVLVNEQEAGAAAATRHWADEVAGRLAQVYAAYLDDEALARLGERLKASSSDEARYAWYAATWEACAQQGRLEEARRVAEEAARALPQHAGARRLLEMLPAFHNVRPASKRFARARMEYLRREKLGETTVLDDVSRAAGAR